MPDEVRTIEAPSRFAVYNQIQKEGGMVVNLTDATGGFTLPAWFSLSIGTGVKRIEVVRLTKNLSAMLIAGLPLSRALSVIERQSDNKYLRTVVVGLSESIKKGSSFHEALAAYPKVFPELLVAMVRSGEESGSLSNALLTVGLQMERSEGLIRKIRGAMIYPSIVIIAIVIVAIMMLLYVVPTLTNTFTQLGVQVPLTTRVFVGISNFLVHNSMLMLGAMVVLVGGGIVFFRSKMGNTLAIATALHIPGISELVRETYTARAARTLSSLLSSGVPVLDALSITKEVVHATIFAKIIEEAEVRVKKGDFLSASFAEHTKLYPILMSEMLAVGEETGNIAQMLKQIAEFYEENVAEKTKDISTIIEPVLILFIGVFVGIFAVSMIAPIYSLSSAF